MSLDYKTDFFAYRDFRNIDYTGLQLDLGLCDWETIYLQPNVDIQLQILNSNIQYLFSQKINKLSEEVIDLRSQRDRLDEKVGQLDREVQGGALCGKVAQLESKLASHQEHNRAYELTPPPRIRDIFRARKTQNTHVDSVIIVKMESAREMIALLKQIGAYRRERKCQLTLKLFGIDSDAAVYVNEQLTRDNYLIFEEAMRMKKHRVLTAVFTRRGLVHVRCMGREGVNCIAHMSELPTLTADPLSSSLTTSLSGATMEA
ncbi:uncharacterized protein [Drosophila kikkawai]|uniref:Uncharacterized protein n=1 Tax=Drosophila kikkawai TaxID=30033 RepID=A0ABM4GNC8_DROKI